MWTTRDGEMRRDERTARNISEGFSMGAESIHTVILVTVLVALGITAAGAGLYYINR